MTVTHTVTVTTTSAAGSGECTGNQLIGTFTESPGGGAAGQIEYVLKVTNTSTATCSVGGAPVVTLLDANGSRLPTRAGSAGVMGIATLQPGDSAKATARFSPTVPGPGDSQSGSCQPKAYTLRVTPNGGGKVDAPIKPPTSVCERGTLAFSSYSGPV